MASKTIGNLELLEARCHFIAIREFKNDLPSRNDQIRARSSSFSSRVTFEFNGWPWKTKGHLFDATWSSVHHFKAIGAFKLKIQSGNAQIGGQYLFWPLWHWPLTLIFLHGHHCCKWPELLKLHDDMIRGTLWQCVTNRQTDGWTKVFFNLLGRN